MQPRTPEITVRFLNGVALECETTCAVSPEVLGRIRNQIAPAALVSDTGGCITVPFFAADGVPDRVRYMYRRPCLDDVLTDGTFPYGHQTIPTGEVAPRQANCSILLLLESPHTNETTRELKAVYPAAGPTGGAIHRHKEALAFVLEQVPVERFANETPFILANPVPHPTSCRCKPIDTALRDHVLQYALTNVERVKDEFERRLQDYHPVVIINACTGAGSRDGLPSTPNEKPDPKELIRRGLWTFFDGKPVHRICCTQEHVQEGGRRRSVLQMRHFPPDGDVSPAYYVVDFPHPSRWRWIWGEGWFRNQGFAAWLAERGSAEHRQE